MKREDFKEFDKFQYLLIPYSYKKTKKFENELEKEAISWFKSLGAQFGRKSQYLVTEQFNWYYAGGMLFFGVKGLSDSEFAYQHVLMALHFQFWKKETFTAGWEFGRKLHLKEIEGKGGGQDNPYSKNDILDYVAWNIGSTWGIYNKEPFLR